MRIWSNIAGLVKAEVVCADPEKMLRSLNDAGMELFGIAKVDEITFTFWIHPADAEKAAELCHKSGKFRILQVKGIRRYVPAALRRPVLVVGICLILWLSWFLPGRVLFVEVDGNQIVPSEQILYAAEDAGLSFGVPRKQIRSEKIKNELLRQLPQLQWAGVNTSGCVATVSVREKAVQEETASRPGISSIVSSMDAYILSATATRGTLMAVPGQTVQAGEVLISGYSDRGSVIRAERAQGEIYGQTNRELRVVFPGIWTSQRVEEAAVEKISLIFGKKRINLWNGSGIYQGSCGRMYKEYCITLPGGYQLPLFLCVESICAYQLQDISPVPQELQTAMGSYAAAYLRSRMAAGKILREQTDFSGEDGMFILAGRYLCREMIGMEQWEKIGE